jgi:hypothetical protein
VPDLAGVLIGQRWLRPRWRQRCQVLWRDVEPERVQLRQDLLTLSAAEAATEMNQAMARTAWGKALRDGYMAQQVYLLMFLVLDCRAYREILHP